MPKLWQDSIEAHRDAVRDALLDAAGSLVAEAGVAALSMAAIAERAGVGRATLYRYFPDLPGILAAWHERHVSGHLAALVATRDAEADPRARLAALLEAYVRVARQSHQHGGDAAAGLHRQPHVAAADKELRAIFAKALAEAAGAGIVRTDVPPSELADYVVSALGGVGGASGASARRRVGLILDGLKPRAPK